MECINCGCENEKVGICEFCGTQMPTAEPRIIYNSRPEPKLKKLTKKEESWLKKQQSSFYKSLYKYYKYHHYLTEKQYYYIINKQKPPLTLWGLYCCMIYSLIITILYLFK